jgi:hypothetical protein
MVRAASPEQISHNSSHSVSPNLSLSLVEEIAERWQLWHRGALVRTVLWKGDIVPIVASRSLCLAFSGGKLLPSDQVILECQKCCVLGVARHRLWFQRVRNGRDGAKGGAGTAEAASSSTNPAANPHAPSKKQYGRELVGLTRDTLENFLSKGTIQVLPRAAQTSLASAAASATASASGRSRATSEGTGQDMVRGTSLDISAPSSPRGATGSTGASGPFLGGEGDREVLLPPSLYDARSNLKGSAAGQNSGLQGDWLKRSCQPPPCSQLHAELLDFLYRSQSRRSTVVGADVSVAPNKDTRSASPTDSSTGGGNNVAASAALLSYEGLQLRMGSVEVMAQILNLQTRLWSQEEDQALLQVNHYIDLWFRPE